MSDSRKSLWSQNRTLIKDYVDNIEDRSSSSKQNTFSLKKQRSEVQRHNFTPSNEYLIDVQTKQRKWLIDRKKPVDFDYSELKTLHMYFEQLDTDKSGEIDIEELEVPFISLNLCNSRD